MKSAKPPAADAPSHRRSQPVRQTRTNPMRNSANAVRSGLGRDSLGSGPLGNQPIDIFPAITHFADTITALPKELVRHFTLLKEVDAKIFAPEEQLFKLVTAATNASYPEIRPRNDAMSTAAPSSAPMSAQGSSSGAPPSVIPHPAPASVDPNLVSAVFDPSNIPRRQLFRQTAFKIQEMLVSLEEKNHVISTANEALQRQLARVEDVWPHLENEFSDEAKWGSTTHWAYPENRNGRAAHDERVRRNGAAALSAATQALVDEAAARSDARKQAVQAKKNLKNQNHESDDEHDSRPKKEGNKRTLTGKSRKTADSGNVGLGISPSTTNGNPPQKRRKVEKEKVTNGAPMERAMSSVFGNNAPKAKTNSPRETPAPEGPKKRKALPSGSGQSKKKNGAPGASPSTISSPVFTAQTEPKPPVRPSPIPAAAPRPASSRARQNSIQSIADSAKIKPPSSAPSKPNGTGNATSNGNGSSHGSGSGSGSGSGNDNSNGINNVNGSVNTPSTPDPGNSALPVKTVPEPKPVKEVIAPIKEEEIVKKDVEPAEIAPEPTPNVNKKEVKADEADGKTDSPATTPLAMATVTTKSGRASKPSTPALATFQEAARARSSRNADSGINSRKGHKKTASVSQTLTLPGVGEQAPTSVRGEDDEGDVDADEPTYCYCNSVSYGEMVACDADDCAREWFHLACVGLKVAPSSKTKWYCEDCKDRLKMGNKKVSAR